MAKILIIDDQEPIRGLLRAILEGVGYEVSEAVNGREGLALCQERPVDLVITDIVMPEMNGLDLILELTRESLSVKVIAMSGEQGTDDHLHAAKLLGARETLHKPFDLEHLLDAVRFHLAQ